MALLLPALLFVAASLHPSAAPVPPATPPQTPDQAEAKVDPALAADIRKLLELSGMLRALDAQMNQMSNSIATMMKTNPLFTEEFVDEFIRRAKQRMTVGLMEGLAVEEYAKYFTRNDIQQMIAYQQSPVGQKAATLLPQMMAELSKKAQEAGQQIGQELATELMQEHPEYLKKTEPPPDASGVSGSAGAVPHISPFPPPPPPPSSQQPFTGPHIEASEQETRLIRRVEPVYPPLAKAAKVQGIVQFSAIIGKDGRVESLVLLRGHPLLVNAAKQAVLQWQYKPYTVKGEAVRIGTEIEVAFNANVPNQ